MTFCKSFRPTKMLTLWNYRNLCSFNCWLSYQQRGSRKTRLRYNLDATISLSDLNFSFSHFSLLFFRIWVQQPVRAQPPPQRAFTREQLRISPALVQLVALVATQTIISTSTTITSTNSATTTAIYSWCWWTRNGHSSASPSFGALVYGKFGSTNTIAMSTCVTNETTNFTLVLTSTWYTSYYCKSQSCDKT